MYFPYMRGKQYELLALKETATNLKNDKVFPVIEPVKANVKPLITTINLLNQHSIYPHIIINPEVGELVGNSPLGLISNLDNEKYIPCIRINTSNVAVALALADQFITDNAIFSLYIQEHVSTSLAKYMKASVVNLIREHSSYPPQYINSAPHSVILRDSFPLKPRNADYPIAPVFFSDAHLTYNNGVLPNQIGFGDFLTMGEKWSEGGGPAYVVAVHISYIDNYMYVKHCISVSGSDNQQDSGSKFLEALQFQVTFANNTISVDQNTLGFQGFLDLYKRKHFSGLGVSKKLSMMHHLETISEFL
jgi:hypothetical protein